MAKTTSMRLIEMMVLKEDINEVLAYLGKLGEFQFQDDFEKEDAGDDNNRLNPDAELFSRLEQVRAALDIEDLKEYTENLALPTDEDYENATKLIASVEDLHQREIDKIDTQKRVADAYTEALAFANLKVSYSELESLSFITMRIGKIDPTMFEDLQMSVGSRAIVVQLGDDKSRIMAVCPKKARFALDSELKKYGFVELQIPKDFKGVPDDMLITLNGDKLSCEKEVADIQKERKNYAETHKDMLLHLLQVYSVGSQVYQVEKKLESTQLVYRITGWLPAYLVRDVTKTIEKFTKDRTGVREYLPEEVPSVMAGHEKVPVQLKHGKLVGSFERLIFSYGSPLYGTVDPTPFVALFFTLLFGIMFGDAGQGLVFLLIGILMACKVVKVGGWNKFAPIFMSIGVSSMIMGLLTGEFFANEEVLRPFERWATGLFGQPRNQILAMMPSSDPASITRMFIFFGFSVAVGFVINTVGLVLNIINQFSLHHPGKALFGKTGISGSCFFWYVVVMAVRIAFFHHSIAVYDWIVIGVTLVCTALGSPLSRLVDGERPVLENGLGTAIIEAFVEVLEVISSYLSNTVSFLRVGAFALAHAVLGFIISTMVGLANPIGGIAISIAGNLVVIVLEGMIVAIQVIRLQYYEFFSKFFNETGREFKPFAFEYKGETKAY
jgi:V/A-type H+-transporting ATPase subunit I